MRACRRVRASTLVTAPRRLACDPWYLGAFCRHQAPPTESASGHVLHAMVLALESVLREIRTAFECKPAVDVTWDPHRVFISFCLLQSDVVSMSSTRMLPITLLGYFWDTHFY